jgi:hypothetical protein
VVRFSFNGIPLAVNSAASLVDVLNDYGRLHHERQRS